MTFSKEDKIAWNSSEIMRELEKIALETDLLEGPPEEAFQSLEMEEKEDEPNWEDEGNNEEKLLDAVEELGFGDEDTPEESEDVLDVFTSRVIKGLEKIAYEAGAINKHEAAHKIERVIMKLKALEGRNG